MNADREILPNGSGFSMLPWESVMDILLLIFSSVSWKKNKKQKS